MKLILLIGPWRLNLDNMLEYRDGDPYENGTPVLEWFDTACTDRPMKIAGYSAFDVDRAIESAGCVTRQFNDERWTYPVCLITVSHITSAATNSTVSP